MNKGTQSGWPIAGVIFLLGIILGFSSASMALANWLFILLATAVLAAAAFSMRPLIIAAAVLLSAVILALSPMELTTTALLPVLGAGLLSIRITRARRVTNPHSQDKHGET